MRILLIRFSALGDVSLIVPVLREFNRAHPQVEVYILTDPRYEMIFKNIPNVKTLPFNIKKDFKGIIGLLKLFFQLQKFSFEKVIDLHQSLRSQIIKLFFLLSFKNVVTIDKGRTEKKKLLGNINATHSPLPHTTERYRQTLIRAGFELGELERKLESSGILFDPNIISQVKTKLQNFNYNQIVGIAPFSAHPMKELPFDKIIDYTKSLLKDAQTLIIYFGYGNTELEKLKFLKSLSPEQILISSEHFSFEEELAVMSLLNSMLTMDSANLHLAELCGCSKVVSIWGPTHHSLGFTPFISGTKNIIEVPVSELSCRPCSVFGNRDCHRGDHACLKKLEFI